tara:strand:- start:213 stop:2096 length:1884 start_codon:yes stop_codon:yes gene_type:complete
MALKYWFEFTDVQTITHKVEIYNDDFVGDSTQIYGSCALTKAGTKDTLESIRGGGLQIDLEATTLLSFNDLYSENEREYSVKYTRNGTDLLFYGWVSPEGLIESFVDDTWIISLDCTDGLGFLTNLSYVENATGLQFVGKQSGLEIITNCLKRTNLQQNIYSSIGIYYTGMTTTENVLANTHFNSNRFVKDDNAETYMNCDEVLRSVIEIFGACITQYKGDWYIYKPNELFDNSELTFFAYDYAGVALATPTVTIDFAQGLGSQINNFYPHHVNKNQQLTIDSAIGAYRINYKYGKIENILDNSTLLNQGTGFQNPSNFDVYDWNVLAPLYIGFDSNNPGVGVAVSNSSSTVIVLESDPLNVTTTADDTFSFSFTQKSVNQTAGVPIYLENNRIGYRVKLTNGSETLYLQSDGTWLASVASLEVGTTYIGFTNLTINANFIPFSGQITVQMQDALNSGFVYVSSIIINLNTNKKGENHTFQITDKPSSKIKDVKTVFNGDDASDFYIGTIYKSDEATPTETWNRSDSRQVAILQIMGEEQMKMYGKPLRVFSGDVYGYIDYLSVIAIDGISNTLFMPIEYEYNAQTNITKLKLKQILNNLLPDSTYLGIDYQLTYDYGNVVEPTIVG